MSEENINFIFDALRTGNIYQLQDVIPKVSYKDLDRYDMYGKTPLIYAIEHPNYQQKSSQTRRYEPSPAPSSLAFINTLLEHSIDIGKSDYEGNTPLMHAARLLHISAIRALFEKGQYKSIEARNNKKETFLVILLKTANGNDGTRKDVEDIVLEVLAVNIKENSPYDLLEDAFDYLLQFDSAKCISRALGKKKLSNSTRQIYFDLWIQQCIKACTFSKIILTLEGIDGVNSEQTLGEMIDCIKVKDSLSVQFMDAYNIKDEKLKADIKQVMLFLFKYDPFIKEDPISGQSIMHKMASSSTPGSDYHKDELGEDIIAYILKYRGDININAQDSKGFTVLMYAIKNCFSIRTMRNIINYKKNNLTLKNNKGENVIDIHPHGLGPVARSFIEEAYNKQIYADQTIRMDTSLTLKQQMALMRKSINSDSALTTDYQRKYFHQLLTCMESDYDLQNKGKLGSSEGMSDLHRSKLVSKRVYLCEELWVDDILDYLMQDDIIDDDMREQIQLAGTRRFKVVKLLSILPFRGEKAYDSFINALRKTNLGFIADELERFDPNAAPTSYEVALPGAQAMPDTTAGIGTAGVVINRAPEGVLHLTIPISLSFASNESGTK